MRYLYRKINDIRYRIDSNGEIEYINYPEDWTTSLISVEDFFEGLKLSEEGTVFKMFLELKR